jgi:hypothetical protein
MTVIQMSDREMTRLRVMIDVGEGRLTPEAAGTLMGTPAGFPASSHLLRA